VVGAAYLAGLAVGFWESVEQLGKYWKVDRRFEPEMDEARVEELEYHWHRAVERAKSWIE